MSDPNAELLDADEVASQAASLADHLARAGVQFLPKSDPDQVTALAAHFSRPEASLKTNQESGDDSSTAAANEAPQNAGPRNTGPQKTGPPPRRASTVAALESASGAYPGTALPVGERQSTLEVLNAEVASCARCEVLASRRTNTVFGEGSAKPRVVFFGEAPGADEDRSGRPFVGEAGKLLTRMIEACKFKRDDVYIMNTVKCRPPANRNPEHAELENCRSFYQQQLQILRPEYIVCLGAISSQELLKSKLAVGRLRGKFHRYHDSKVLVTYHPAYLLRTPSAKKAAWEDLQIMLRDAGIVPG